METQQRVGNEIPVVLCVCRLGDVSCLAEPEDLLAYKDSEVFGAIQDIVMNCTRHRLSLPSHLVENHLCVIFKKNGFIFLQSCMRGAHLSDIEISVCLCLFP